MYNLFSSFKKKLNYKKHFKEQDKQIIKDYHGNLIFYGLCYLKFWLIVLGIIGAVILIYYGTSKYLDNNSISSYKITQDANIRTKPSANSEIYKTLKSGTTLKGKDTGNWIEISEKGKSYYVAKSLTAPSASGIILGAKILRFISSLVPVGIPAIYKYIKNLYANYSVVQIIIIIGCIFILSMVYAKLARDKHYAMEYTLEKICDNCGYFGAIERSEELIDSETNQKTIITHETTTSEMKNKNGVVIGTVENRTPISRIVNVHNDKYRISFFCNKCQNTSYKYRTETWEGMS